jgi:ubiquinone/menaquinone biosynthesis C-methylase UbiE
MAKLPAKLNKNDIIEVYTQTAPIYDVWGWLTETKARHTVLELANIQNGEAVLEVAVGTGVTFREILAANPDGSNFGIDLTQAMVDRANARVANTNARNYSISRGDAHHLAFPDGHFDLLINAYMFDLLPEEDFSIILGEFKRVLKPEGRLIIANMAKGQHFFQGFWEWLYKINPRWLGGCRFVSLSQPVAVAGFKIRHRQNLSQFGFPSEIISASL